MHSLMSIQAIYSRARRFKVHVSLIYSTEMERQLFRYVCETGNLNGDLQALPLFAQTNGDMFEWSGRMGRMES
jgi:hypothetical protein